MEKENLMDDLDKIQQQIKEKQEHYQEQTLASEPISGEDRAKAIVEIAKQPENMVKLAVSDKTVNKIKNDEGTIARIDKTADKIIDSAVTVIENEAERNEHSSEKDKLQAYFDRHKEELKTAGIDQVTYLEDMERGVKWHRKWTKVHWVLFGWWLTGIRTFWLKAKPFKWVLNTLAILLSVGVGIGIIFAIISLIKLF